MAKLQTRLEKLESERDSAQGPDIIILRPLVAPGETEKEITEICIRGGLKVSRLPHETEDEFTERAAVQARALKKDAVSLVVGK
jgi:hypothetical protein